LESASNGKDSQPKATVLEANFYELEVRRHYAAFASHYGVLADPCRVRTPTDKGKIESMIKYVKETVSKEGILKMQMKSEYSYNNGLITKTPGVEF